jgi:predicted secreted protein
MLDSIPTGGYRWYPSFDTNMISLVSHNFQRPNDLVGGSTKETFAFRAIDSGTTVLKMIYKRDWEDVIISEKDFLIDVE